MSQQTQHQILIAGGGIGGLAAALACTRAGAGVQLFERTAQFSEVGAGIQLGPNVVKVLQGWGLGDALQSVAALPQRLQVRSALSGEELGMLRLGEFMVQRYGAPYLTMHRADLHALLLAALQKQENCRLSPDAPLERFTQVDDGVCLHTTDGRTAQGAMLVAADGLWSRVRTQLLGDEPPRVSGHLAYRALVQQDSLPQQLRSNQVTIWLGPDLHVVQYPVRGGEWLNVVAIIQGQVAQDELENWDHGANAADLRAALAGSCHPLAELIHNIAHWRLWPLCDRPPLRGPQEHALGRVALLGDAAHPMRPYLAQGAGMAIEDAACLGALLAHSAEDVPALLQRYAALRWQRNARVQARAIRNGEVFHARGLLRWGRNLSLKLLGERLLDQPWLFQGPQGAGTTQFGA